MKYEVQKNEQLQWTLWRIADDGQATSVALIPSEEDANYITSVLNDALKETPSRAKPIE